VRIEPDGDIENLLELDLRPAYHKLASQSIQNYVGREVEEAMTIGSGAGRND
jgi:hypothetical protein